VLHEIDARVKLLGTIILIILTVSTFMIEKVAVVLLSLLVIAKFSSLSFKEIFKRIWLFTIFSFVVVIPVSLSDPHYAFIFTLRVATSLIAVQMLIMTTPFNEVVFGLKSFRVPEIFISALWLGYRYALLMFRELLKIMIARESRRVSRGSHLDVWKKGGQAMGIFFIRSYEKAERVQLAMMARGDRLITYKRELKSLDAIYALLILFIAGWWLVI
jgi:cobalt/nickel transport system permease protein